MTVASLAYTAVFLAFAGLAVLCAADIWAAYKRDVRSGRYR